MPSTLNQRLHERLAALLAERPDLEAAVDLQQNLLAREIELSEVCLAGGLPRLSLPARYIAAKLDDGIPLLFGEPVPLPHQLLTLAIRDFCERLTTGHTAEPAAAIQAAFDQQLDPTAIVSACFGRDQNRVRALAQHASVMPDLLWLVADLTVAPLAYLLQQHLFRDSAITATPLGDALGRWDSGFCPACGSWPALLEASGDGHTLRCSFCAMGWAISSYRCLYCGNDDASFLTAAPNTDVPGRRLQLCGACGAYAKVLDLPAPTEFPLVAIEDLASLDLDMAAIERQYGRPVLPTISRKSSAIARAHT